MPRYVVLFLHPGQCEGRVLQPGRPTQWQQKGGLYTKAFPLFSGPGPNIMTIMAANKNYTATEWLSDKINTYFSIK